MGEVRIVGNLPEKPVRVGEAFCGALEVADAERHKAQTWFHVVISRMGKVGRTFNSFPRRLGLGALEGHGALLHVRIDGERVAGGDFAVQQLQGQRVPCALIARGVRSKRDKQGLIFNLLLGAALQQQYQIFDGPRQGQFFSDDD